MPTSKILLSDLPASGWWSSGIPHYDDNIAMIQGTIPDAALARREHDFLRSVLEEYAEVTMLPFPDTTNHDAVFVRDSFISDQAGTVVMARFTQDQRSGEQSLMEAILNERDYTPSMLPQDARAEGGDVFILKQQGVLFAGNGRTNKAGVTALEEIFGLANHCVIESDAFHVDTVFSVVRDRSGKVVAALTCPGQIHNWDEVRDFLKQHDIALVEVPFQDTIGSSGSVGSMAVNCLALPGVLIGGAPFSDPRVAQRLEAFGVVHRVAPVTQFCLSGGGVNCLTNEL